MKTSTPSQYFIYIIGESKRGLNFKVGISKDPAKRRKQLQTGNPRPLRVLAKWDVGTRARAKARETIIHNRLRAERSLSNGEWFQAPFCKVYEVTKDIATRDTLRGVTVAARTKYR